MNFFLPLIIILNSSIALAEISNFDSITQSLKMGPKLDCSSMDKDELALQCAHALCGDPKRYSSSLELENVSAKLDQKQINETKNETLMRMQKYTEEVKKNLSTFGEKVDFNHFSDNDFEKIITFLSNLTKEGAWNKNLRTADDYQFAEIIKNFNFKASPKLATRLKFITKDEGQSPAEGELCNLGCRKNLEKYFKGSSFAAIKKKIISNLENKMKDPDVIATCQASHTFDKINQLKRRSC